MDVLIIGSTGSTGKRYGSILRMLGCNVIGYDIVNARNNQKLPMSDAVIIASPTVLHYEHFKRALSANYKKILIEKPVSKDARDIDDMISMSEGREISMVCNWKFSSFVTLSPNSHEISYNFYNCGNDNDKIWDMCQLVYLQEGDLYDFSYDSPFFVVWIDGFPITLLDIEKSYFRMLSYWICKPGELWTLIDARKICEKIGKYLNP